MNASNSVTISSSSILASMIYVTAWNSITVNDTSKILTD
jgi:hypothetical protein